MKADLLESPIDMDVETRMESATNIWLLLGGLDLWEVDDKLAEELLGFSSDFLTNWRNDRDSTVVDYVCVPSVLSEERLSALNIAMIYSSVPSLNERTVLKLGLKSDFDFSPANFVRNAKIEGISILDHFLTRSLESSRKASNFLRNLK